MTPRQLVPLAADLGAVLLATRAEIRQVEEGLYRLFAAHGLRSEVFVLLKGIFLSAWEEGGEPFSLIRHVRGSAGVDLGRLGRALTLTEEWGRLGPQGPDPAEVRRQIDALQAPGPPRTWTLVGAAAATAGIYGLFFGGTGLEALWAAGAAALAQALRPLWARLLPPLADAFVTAVLLTLAALAAPLVVAGADPVRVVTGGVMILIPGVALVNGVKDVLHGDTVSSLYRLADAGLQTAAIAAGVALVLSTGGFHG